MTYEGFRLRISKIWRKKLANFRRKKLEGSDFTIISNNCWGGMIYESYNLLKESPTIGLFFFAADYIHFLKNLRESFAAQLRFISPEESKWKEIPELAGDKRFGCYPIGQLFIKGKTVEIFFLHYHSESEAKAKWERRCKRVNWKHMLVKFNDQNGTTQKDLDEFLQLPYNKLFFTCKKWENMDQNCYVINQPYCYSSITTSREPFGNNRYVNITEKINFLYKNAN